MLYLKIFEFSRFLNVVLPLMLQKLVIKILGRGVIEG